MKAVIAASLVSLVAIAHPAQAQPTFARLQPSGLPTIFVTDRNGLETQGKLVQITDSAIIIKVDGVPRTFTADEVSLVERKGDSLKNGTIAGVTTGIVLGVLSMGLADCPGGGSRCPGARVAGVALSAAFYGAIGVGIDALIPGRTRIWPAKQTSSGLVTTASPKSRRLFVGWRITR